MKLRFAALLAVVVGCSFESAGVLETVDNRCGGDADCLGGVCDGNICIDDSNAAEIAIEVVRTIPEAVPPIPTSWAFRSERFQGASALDLVLPATREVRGNVRWDGQRVPANLRFVRRMAESVAPLQPVPIDVDTLREPGGGEGAQAYDFTIVLVAGETYDVVVLPTADMVVSPMDASAPAIRSLPPLYLRIPIESNGSSEPLRFDIAFPLDLDGACTANRRSNCTLEGEVVSVDEEVLLPEAGLQVRAIDTTSGRVVSSIAETDPAGRFAIRIGEETSDYLIRVTSSAGAEPFPAVSVDPEVVFAEPAQTIYIPRLKSVQHTGRVQDESGAPVPKATVRFTTDSVFGDGGLGLQGSFSGSAKTNEDGSFLLALLPGFYAVTVTPPDDAQSAWGTLTSEALVGQGLGAEDLTLPSQFQLFGTVRTYKEEVAVGVAVSARARQDPEIASMHRSEEAVSDASGRFSMRMDLGLYDVHVKVPSETGYGWLVEPALIMDDDLTRIYRLVPPIPIEGVVQASDGTVVPDVSIRAYVLTNDGAPSRTIQVAETVSDEEGNYRLLISPSLRDE
jgi:hypothetical protein